MLKKLFEKYQGLMTQFSRFIGIGFLNTAVDFSVINILMAYSGITQGAWLSGLKIVSFTIAVTHSYFWNKFWTFQVKAEHFLIFTFKVAAAAMSGLAVVVLAFLGAGKKFGPLYFIIVLAVFFIVEYMLWKLFGLNANARSQKEERQFFMFLIVSVIGALISAAIVWIVTVSFVPPPFGVTRQLWANVANALAVCVGLFWNFIGYKFFVFKK